MTSPEDAFRYVNIYLLTNSYSLTKIVKANLLIWISKN